MQDHCEPQPPNINALRSLDCICLRPTTSHQGWYEVLHLHTNRIINRGTLTSTAITPSIITQVHAITNIDKMHDGLEIKNRTNWIVLDSSLITGVDYDEDLFRNQDSDLENSHLNEHQESNFEDQDSNLDEEEF